MGDVFTELFNSDLGFKIGVGIAFIGAAVITIWFAINTKRHNAKYKNRQSR